MQRRVWLRVALAAGAGFGSLAVCSGAVVAIIVLFVKSIDFAWISSGLDPLLFWLGVSAAMIVAGASLSLPPRALGAREGHLLKTTLLSGLGFCAFVFGSFLTLATPPFVGPLIALGGLIGTPAIGSLVAIREDGQIAARTLRGTLITASAIYCASLLAYWLEVFGESWSTVLVSMIVAACSWLVLPGIVAMLRSG